jgi:hypothetical protein
MIRQTVSRAFARKLDLDAPAPSERIVELTPTEKRLQRVFEELHAAFAAEVERRPPAGDPPATGGPAFAVSPVESKAAGLEFSVSFPGGYCRVVNTMLGVVWMHTELDGRSLGGSFLTFHPDEEDIPQLIEKPETESRAGFHFTSVPKLVRGVLGGRMTSVEDPERALLRGWERAPASSAAEVEAEAARDGQEGRGR